MRLSELAGLVSALGVYPQDAEPGLEITGARALAEAGGGDASFIKDKRHLKEALPSGASLVLVGEFYDGLPMPQMKVRDPYRAFALLLGALHPADHGPAGVSPGAIVPGSASIAAGVTVMAGAYVAEGASIGPRSVLYPGVYVGRGSSVGEDCVLWPGAVVRDGVSLGDRVIIHPGAVIGSDGFGYASGPDGHMKVPHVGGVTLGDDVEVGANSTIDRATTGMTVIGRGTKIDNLVQIGHNVRMGRDCLIVAGTSIGGSCRIGDGVLMGGQCAIRDNVTIAAGAMLAARTGVGSDLEKGTYGGGPAIGLKNWIKSAALFERLPELLQRLRELERVCQVGGRKEK